VKHWSQLSIALAIGILAVVGPGVAPASADSVSVTLSSRPAAAGDLIYLTAVVSPSMTGGEVRFDSDQGLLATSLVIFGKAETWFMPRVSGTITVTATYTSLDGGTTGVSAPLAIAAKGGAAGSVSLALAVAGNPIVGTKATITATVTPSTSMGRVTFSVDGSKLATTDVNSGQAAITWTPARAGQLTLSARYSGTAVDDVVASKAVTVAPAGGQGGTKPDVIVIDPAGDLTPWAASASVTLPNGTSRQLVASAASGATVALAVAGPCSLGNNLLTIDAGSNTCTLTAVSLGGNGFGPATQNYGIVLVPGHQEADLEAPPSGTVVRNSSFRLGPAGQATNLGMAVRWSVSKASKAVCRVKASAGGPRLAIGARPGSCLVKVRAAGVPGQWKPFSATRSYRIQ
jgi:hypothetical protein